MKRREFLASAAVASVAAATAPNSLSGAADTGAGNREFYQLRRYQLARGPQLKLADDYFRLALVPALNRMGLTPVGVFNLTIGPDTPAMYVLIPSSTVDALSSIENRLAQDAEYAKSGTDFLKAPAKEPAFHEVEISLMQAFENMPKLKVPRAPRTIARGFSSCGHTKARAKSCTKKSGNVQLLRNGAAGAIQHGSRVLWRHDRGARMPNLTYMLAFDNLADREKKFLAFNDSDWMESAAGRSPVSAGDRCHGDELHPDSHRLLPDIGARRSPAAAALRRPWRHFRLLSL